MFILPFPCSLISIGECFEAKTNKTFEKNVFVSCNRGSFTSLWNRLFFFFNSNHWDFSDKCPLLPVKPLFKNQYKFQIICENFLDHLSPLEAFSPFGSLKTY